MDDRASRVFMGLCVLVLLWIGVYWLWQPGASAPALSPRDASAGRAPDREPPGVPPDRLPAASRPDPASAPPGGVTPPEFRDYIVRGDDTFERIAERELGDAALWTVVARANPLKDPRRLRAGQVLRLPLDATNVQGRPAPGPAPATREPERPPPGAVTYTVRPGDTLSEIAKRHYGATAYARMIYEANTDTMRDINSLSVGQTLRLPPTPRPD